MEYVLLLNKIKKLFVSKWRKITIVAAESCSTTDCTQKHAHRWKQVWKDKKRNTYMRSIKRIAYVKNKKISNILETDALMQCQG